MKPNAKIASVRVLDRGRQGKVGVVTTEAGYVYVCTWSSDSDLDEETVRSLWARERWAFRPYDESTGIYIWSRAK